MSSLQYAFSEELNEVISVDEAYDLFWQGKLTDKKKFKCPDNNCCAQITCACMDTTELELKQAPNFRVYGEHTPDCEYLSFLKRNGYSGGGRGGLDTSEQNCAEFFIHRNQRPLEVTDFPSVGNRAAARQKATVGYGAYSARPKFYSIRPIVDRFFVFHEDGVLSERFIKISGQIKTYKQLFKGIFKQNIDKTDAQPLIYWGLAYINRTRKKDAFQISFSGTFIHNGQEVRPSIFIKDTILDEYQYNKRLREYLNLNNVEQGIQFFAFIYGYPIVSQKLDKAYIKFELDNLDYLDFKSKSYFDKLRKKEFS